MSIKEELVPLSLTGHRRGLYKLRAGSYRIIYSFDKTTQVITIHHIGYRKEGYHL